MNIILSVAVVGLVLWVARLSRQVKCLQGNVIDVLTTSNNSLKTNMRSLDLTDQRLSRLERQAPDLDIDFDAYPDIDFTSHITDTLPTYPSTQSDKPIDND